MTREEKIKNEKVSTEVQKNALNKSNITSRFIFGLVAVIFTALILAWFAIWQTIEYTECKWTYSENNTVKAWQYLLHGLWGIFFVTSPFWWIGSVILSVKMLLPKNTTNGKGKGI